MVRRVIELPLVYKSYVWYSPDQKRISAHYHRQITNALSVRDAERAELVMREHIFEARDLLVANVGDRPRGPLSEQAIDRSAAVEEARRVGPLAGVRVIELGTLLAGPFTGRLLGDLGAEIIKVEDPTRPDPIREWGKARYEGRSLWWPVQSRNKKCVTLNLRSERGRSSCSSSCAAQTSSRRTSVRERSSAESRLRADARSEPGDHPGTRLRIRPDRPVRGARGNSHPSPRPWAGCATSTGSPASRRRASTSRWATHWQGCSPPRESSPPYWRDAAAAAGRARWSTSRCSRRRSRCSRAPCRSTTGWGSCEARWAGPQGVAPSNIFKSSDDKWMVIAANADNVYRRLCEAVGQPELADDERFATHLARGENQEELEGIVAEWASRHTAAEIDRILNEAGVICGPIYTIADIFVPQFQARDMLLEHVDPEFGPYIRARDRPQAVGDTRRGALVGAGTRAATIARCTAGCSGSRTTSSRR